jgi:predicted transcriptional regulator
MSAQKKEIRLHEGELNVMELLWSNKVLAAKDISKIIKEYIGWEKHKESKNTTYTYIKRLIDKGAITREDPGFLCRAAITKKQVQEIETSVLIKNLYNGSVATFIHDYFENVIIREHAFPAAQPEELRAELEKVVSNRN